MALFSYKPFCFSRLNDNVHGLVSIKIIPFVHELAWKASIDFWTFYC